MSVNQCVEDAHFLDLRCVGQSCWWNKMTFSNVFPESWVELVQSLNVNRRPQDFCLGIGIEIGNLGIWISS